MKMLRIPQMLSAGDVHHHELPPRPLMRSLRAPAAPVVPSAHERSLRRGRVRGHGVGSGPPPRRPPPAARRRLHGPPIPHGAAPLRPSLARRRRRRGAGDGPPDPCRVRLAGEPPRQRASMPYQPGPPPPPSASTTNCRRAKGPSAPPPIHVPSPPLSASPPLSLSLPSSISLPPHLHLSITRPSSAHLPCVRVCPPRLTSLALVAAAGRRRSPTGRGGRRVRRPRSAPERRRGRRCAGGQRVACGGGSGGAGGGRGRGLRPQGAAAAAAASAASAAAAAAAIRPGRGAASLTLNLASPPSPSSLGDERAARAEENVSSGPDAIARRDAAACPACPPLVALRVDAIPRGSVAHHPWAVSATRGPLTPP